MYTLLFVYTITNSQTTIFYENFENTSEGELSTTTFNGWKQYTSSATESDWAISDNCAISGSYSMTLHSYGAYCEYAWDDYGEEIAYYAHTIDATSFNSVIISFDWKCGGETSYDYGKLCYSSDGITWTDFSNSGNYVDESNPTTLHSVTDLDISDIDGTEFYIGFKWKNDGSAGTDPGWNVDNIIIEGTSNCSVNAGTATISENPVTACNTVTATLSGYDPAPASIMWQYSIDNSTWTNSGETSSSYSLSIAQRTYIRAQVTNGCTSTSNTIIVTTNNDNYYVNDNSTTNDIWCTEIGNASNTGKGPCSPKTTLQDIFDSYDINAGDTIFIDAGSYTMGLDIINDDEGNSSNNVVIIGAGRDLTHLTAPTNDDNFLLQNAGYITIKNMHLSSEETSNYNYFVEEGVYNIIDNCLLESSKNTNIYYQSNGGSYDIDDNSIINSTITNHSSAGYNIWINGDGDDHIINNCIITSTGTGGAKAIYLTDRSFGTNEMWPTAIHMHNNTVTADDYGFFSNSVNGNTMETFDIHDNTFNIQSSDKTDGCSLYLMNHGISSSDISNIFNNRINGGRAGIYLTSDVDYVHFYNNFIAGSLYGIYIDDASSNDNDLQHNSFYTERQCAYFDNGSNAYWNVRNNIFYTTANSSYSCIFSSNSNTFVTCDYNIYYAPNGANVALYNGSTYSTLAAWQGVNHHDGSGNGDNNSFYTDPNYQNASNGSLELTGNYKTGVSISTITIDIYSTNRTNPTIGAWEENSPLPIELINFNAKCKGQYVELNWLTKTENNNDYFTIEKSIDGYTFFEIAKIYGAGNSNSIIEYTYKDTSLLQDFYYYRLKQTDFDGTNKTFSTITSECEYNNDNTFLFIKKNRYETIAVLKNPVANTTYKITLLSLTGKVIQEASVNNTNNDKIDYLINNNSLKEGLYIIMYKSNKDVYVKKLVISH